MEDEKMKEAPVKRLERNLKYHGNILNVYEDVVEVNGHIAHWDFIHHHLLYHKQYRCQ